MRSRSLLLGIAIGLLAGPSFADGAFPDSLGILLPQDRPNRIVAATNFGLVVTDDSGQSWHYICEQVAGTNAWNYSLGAPPSDAMYSIAIEGFRSSFDDGCSWSTATGVFKDGTVNDGFPSPTTSRVAVVGMLALADGGEQQAVLLSDDSGRTFNQIAYRSDIGTYVTGVEIPRTDPQTLFISTYNPDTPLSGARISHDSGANWTELDVTGFESAQIRIAGVDAFDARRVYLRVQLSTGAEYLVAAEEGAPPKQLALAPGIMTGFTQRANGELIVTGTSGGYVSGFADGGTFTPHAGPHLRGIGERGGVLFAVTDSAKESYAVASSADGESWQPLLRYSDIQGPLQCGNVPERCARAWDTLRLTLGIPQGAVVDGGTDTPKPEPKTCGCAAVNGGAFLAALLAALAMRMLRRSAR